MRGRHDNSTIKTMILNGKLESRRGSHARGEHVTPSGVQTGYYSVRKYRTACSGIMTDKECSVFEEGSNG
jgi:hypothetical protein